MPKAIIKKFQFLVWGILLILVGACASKTFAQSSLSVMKTDEVYTVIIDGARVGHLKVTTTGNAVAIDYDYKNNGRGPTIKDTIILNGQGLPVQRDISGNTTFGKLLTGR